MKILPMAPAETPQSPAAPANIARDAEKTDALTPAIVQAISALARSLGIGFVAEGVEEAGQAEYLKTCDCAEMQGYLFGRPVPAEELPEIVSRFGPQTMRLSA